MSTAHAIAKRHEYDQHNGRFGSCNQEQTRTCVAFHAAFAIEKLENHHKIEKNKKDTSDINPPLVIEDCKNADK